jgi:acetylglutamate kinase
VVKIGGNIIDDATELNHFYPILLNRWTKSFSTYGGKSATKMAQSIGLVPEMIDGRRITDAAMLEVVVMIYAGQINKDIVAQLQANKTNAMGFSGADGNLIQSNKRNHPTIDYGYVGDVQKSSSLLQTPLLRVSLLFLCDYTR